MVAPDLLSRAPSVGDETRNGPTPLLEVEDLAVSFTYDRRTVTVVRSASLKVLPGQVVGLVGESGSGKTVTSMAAMGLVPRLGGKITNGRILLDGRDVTRLPERDWAHLRGNVIGMVFQQPTRCLNPAFTVGEQIAEVVRRHRGASRREAWDRAVEMLEKTHIPRAAQRAKDYPHQLSGGMCQRVGIAMALACDPKLLIADEPTTALDVTVQRTILDLMLELREMMDISVLFITHDLGVIAEMCDHVAVMYAGEVVEHGEVHQLFASPQHPYTAGLLNGLPAGGGKVRVLSAIPGQVPPVDAMPSGCRFGPRCDHYVAEICASEPPPLVKVGPESWSRCRRVADLDLRRLT